MPAPKMLHDALDAIADSMSQQNKSSGAAVMGVQTRDGKEMPLSLILVIGTNQVDEILRKLEMPEPPPLA